MTRERKASRQTLALLAALLQQPKLWRHGYELAEATGLQSGTLYPVLMRLSDRGLLDSKWSAPEVPGRPARHLYRLTASGACYAQAQVAVAAPPGAAVRVIRNGA